MIKKVLVLTFLTFLFVQGSRVWAPKPFFIPGPPGNLIDYDLETYKIGNEPVKELSFKSFVFYFGNACEKFNSTINATIGPVCHVFGPSCNVYRAAYYAADAGCSAIVMRKFFPGPAGGRARLNWLDKNKWKYNGTFIPIYETAFDSIKRNGTIVNKTIGYTFAFKNVMINLTNDPNPWIQEFDSPQFIFFQILFILTTVALFILLFITLNKKFKSFGHVFKKSECNIGILTLHFMFWSLVFRLIISIDPIRSRGVLEFVSFNVMPTINTSAFFIVNAFLAFHFIGIVQRTRKISTRVKKFLSKPMAIGFLLFSIACSVMIIIRGVVFALYMTSRNLTTAAGYLGLIGIGISSIFYFISGLVLVIVIRKISINNKSKNSEKFVVMILLSGISMLGHFIPGLVCIMPSMTCFFYPQRLSAMVLSQQFAMNLTTFFQIMIFFTRVSDKGKFTSTKTTNKSKLKSIDYGAVDTSVRSKKSKNSTKTMDDETLDTSVSSESESDIK